MLQSKIGFSNWKKSDLKKGFFADICLWFVSTRDLHRLIDLPAKDFIAGLIHAIS